MSKYILSLLLFTSLLCAEVHPLTLQQALELAARQNPEVALARLDEQRAAEGIQVALDPFRPKVYGGSGLAYTYGYPNSIDGSAPSIIQLNNRHGASSIVQRVMRWPPPVKLLAALNSAPKLKPKTWHIRPLYLFLTAATIAHEG